MQGSRTVKTWWGIPSSQFCWAEKGFSVMSHNNGSVANILRENRAIFSAGYGRLIQAKWDKKITDFQCSYNWTWLAPDITS